MRWLLLTLVLLASSTGLLGWVYLRDRDTHWRPPEPQLASAAAEGALNELGGAGCSAGCSAEVLTRLAPYSWLARITIRGRSRCVQIDLMTFSLRGPHAPAGVEPHRCPHVTCVATWQELPTGTKSRRPTLHELRQETKSGRITTRDAEACIKTSSIRARHRRWTGRRTWKETRTDPLGTVLTRTGRTARGRGGGEPRACW